MHSQTNDSGNQILGFPVVTENVPQNGNILVYNNGRWLVGSVASTGGLTTIDSVGTGASIIFGEFADTAYLKSVVAGTGITVTSLANEVQISMSGGVLPSGGFANVGVGGGQFYKDTTTTVNFRTLAAGSNMDIITGTNEVTMGVTANPSFSSVTTDLVTSSGTTVTVNKRLLPTGGLYDSIGLLGSAGQVLTNTGSGITEWGQPTFSNLNGLAFAGLATGQVLTYNGTLWVNQAPAVSSFNSRTGAIMPASGDYGITQLSGVSISSPSSGDILSFNGTNWVNSAAGVDVNIYNTDGTISANRTVSGAGRNLTFAQCKLFLTDSLYANYVNNTTATNCFLSYNYTTGATASMIAGYTGKSYMSEFGGKNGQGDWGQFYKRTYTSNASVNLRVTYSIRGANDSTSVVWNVVGSVDAPQTTWMCVPPLTSCFNQGNCYNLEIYFSGNDAYLRIIKTFDGSNPGVNSNVYIIDYTSEDGSADTSVTTGTGGTLATTYYPAPRKKVDFFNDVGNVPGTLFNWITGYQVAIELTVSGSGGGAGRQAISVRLNGFVIGTLRGCNTGGVGQLCMTPVAPSILNGGIILVGTNTITIDSNPYTADQSYSMTVIQTQ